jgi:Protein of unknown function (DUF3634)
MYLLVAILILAVLAVPFFVALARATELFLIDVSDGRAVHRRGRLPQRLLNDIVDVVRRPAIARCEIRVVAEAGRPRVVVRGKISDAQLQRLRNVVGKFQVAQIRAGKRARGG